MKVVKFIKLYNLWFKINFILVDKKTLFSYIQRLENEILEEKDIQIKLHKDLEKKEIEFINLNKDLDKTKEVYENKIGFLNTKIRSDEDILSDIKLELKNKCEVITFIILIISISIKIFRILKN